LKKLLLRISVLSLLTSTSIPAVAQENLVYVPVNPCRIVDTRPSSGGEGAIAADTSRNFLVSGTVSSQGGTSAGCPSPRPDTEPLAVSAYVVAVPVSGSTAGALSAYPSDQTAPAAGEGATVNFAAGQVIGNTTNITLCEPDSCPTSGDTGEFAVLARNTIQHVVVDVQGYFYPAAGTCPDDMVAAGSICIDKYEASLWDAATGGSSIPATTCLADGSDCGKNAANPIFAQSVVNVTPTRQVSWYQAAQACANVGKRLPTTADWQSAAAGTPAGANSDPADSCNATTGGAVAVTGASSAGTLPCVSSAGAFDMVGNLWEWSAELTDFATAGGFSFSTTDAGWGRILGGSYNSGNSNSTQDVATVGGGPGLANNSEIGFRCVR